MAAQLQARGAQVHRDGLLLDVTTTDVDPFDLITQVLAETGSGMQLLRPSETTLEDAYLNQDLGAV